MYNYRHLGAGFCTDDWVYLPEGGYPPLLAETDPLYDSDRLRECMNRCIHAAENSLAGSGAAASTEISDQAFYVNGNNQCACASGSCDNFSNDAYQAYGIVQGKSRNALKKIDVSLRGYNALKNK